MGREIRRVPAGWGHPRDERTGEYRPLFDEDFDTAASEWAKDGLAFLSGDQLRYGPDRADYPRTWTGYVEWFGTLDDPEHYRPAWSDDEATHFQVYETVSEGTPVSPVLPTLEAVVDWLVEHGAGGVVGPMSREAAEAFAGYGYAPSFIVSGGRLMNGIEAMGETHGDQ